MSLILDALRKSEAERRRGQSPDVFAATPGLPASRAPAPRVWPLLLLGAMLLGSAWLIWNAGRPAEEASDATPAPAAAASAPAPRIIVLPAAAPPPRNAARKPARAPSDEAATASTPAAPVRPAWPAPPPEPPPVAAPDAPPDPDLPPIAVLDAATRATLPPLKLSMHVYTDDPARRFAIVDGQRVTEGARLGAGTVLQVRRDGLVIEVDGRRLLLPKP